MPRVKKDRTAAGGLNAAQCCQAQFECDSLRPATDDTNKTELRAQRDCYAALFEQLCGGSHSSLAPPHDP